MKKIIVILLSLAALFSLAACSAGKSGKQSAVDQIKAKKQLVVAMNPDFAPFEYKTMVDGKNKVVGSDVKLAQAIADELGVELVISEMSFDNVLNSLKSGKADIAISGISATKERAKIYDFSEPYYKARNVVVTQAADADKYTSAGSLADKSVAVQKGSVQEKVAKEQLKGINPVSLAGPGPMINELSAGKVEAAVLEEPIAKGYVASNPDIAVTAIELDSSETDAYAVAINKGSADLKKVVDKVVKELTASGQYDSYVQEAQEQSAKSSSNKQE